MEKINKAKYICVLYIEQYFMIELQVAINKKDTKLVYGLSSNS